jgi:hypothetical protein
MPETKMLIERIVESFLARKAFDRESFVQAAATIRLLSDGKGDAPGLSVNSMPHQMERRSLQRIYDFPIENSL